MLYEGVFRCIQEKLSIRKIVPYNLVVMVLDGAGCRSLGLNRPVPASDGGNAKVPASHFPASAGI
jgi:hypothetical protein